MTCCSGMSDAHRVRRPRPERQGNAGAPARGSARAGGPPGPGRCPFPTTTRPSARRSGPRLPGGREHPPEVMQLLYVANRFEYKPRLDRWLASATIVVCDRYRASSVAYGEAQGLDAEWLEDIQQGLPPAWLTVLLDIAPETAAARKAAGRDRYERDLDLLARVRASYRRQAAQREWVVIDAEQPHDGVAAAVEDAVWSRLSPPSARSPLPHRLRAAPGSTPPSSRPSSSRRRRARQCGSAAEWSTLSDQPPTRTGPPVEGLPDIDAPSAAPSALPVAVRSAGGAGRARPAARGGAQGRRPG